MGPAVSDVISQIGDSWGTVIVAILGFAGILLTQSITNRRERTLQERLLVHQVGADLRLRRTDAYSELTDAIMHFMLVIPDVLLPESTAGDLDAEERGPINKASVRAQLLASEPVKQSISDLMDRVYEYADDLSQATWEAVDDATDDFIAAAQAEDDNGNVLGRQKHRRRRVFGGYPVDRTSQAKKESGPDET
ncbi:hypothetical protein D6T63_04255 [Arthrobacter cheniae]|uniref:Uncharacterized protein n=1 Tax=Arthrobacter cheniae TaxID=1258888 RepID=A0A3A5M6Z6_9MICC|nr:hypothetical protein D6T63_04255 [Arthrobacter cheniae]